MHGINFQLKHRRLKCVCVYEDGKRKTHSSCSKRIKMKARCCANIRKTMLINDDDDNNDDVHDDDTEAIAQITNNNNNNRAPL